MRLFWGLLDDEGEEEEAMEWLGMEVESKGRRGR